MGRFHFTSDVNGENFAAHYTPKRGRVWCIRARNALNVLRGTTASGLGAVTELEYAVFNFEANKARKNDEKGDDMSQLAESMDDFRAGINNNVALRSLIVHGQYDTVTPYFAIKRLMHQSRLKPDVKNGITEKLYEGGHMFYSWHEQRKQFC